MNGVTGRMGYRQHLVRSLLAIREARAACRCATATGSGPSRSWSAATRPSCAEIADRHGLTEWTTDLDAALARPTTSQIYFDAQVTQRSGRRRSGRRSTPASTSTPRSRPPTTLDRRRRAGPRRRRGRHQARRRAGQAVPARPAQARRGSSTAASSAGSSRCAASSATGSSRATGRPRSARRWNYRAADGGGIVRRHVPALALRAGAALRPGPRGHRARHHAHPAALGRARASRTTATADDAAYGIFELDGGIVAQINSSWAVRVNRDELVEFQVDGTEGSAVAGLRDCRVQHRGRHPEAGVEPGPAGHRARSATSGRRCRTTRSSTTASRRSGRCSCGTSPRTPRTPGTCGRRPRRAARRAGPAVGPRGPPDRGPGAGAVSRRAACRTGALHAVRRGRRVRRAGPRRSPAGWPTPPRTSSPTRAAENVPGAPAGARLGRHPRLPPPPVVARLRRGRGDGHRPARDGPGLPGGPRS